MRVDAVVVLNVAQQESAWSLAGMMEGPGGGLKPRAGEAGYEGRL